MNLFHKITFWASTLLFWGTLITCAILTKGQIWLGDGGVAMFSFLSTGFFWIILMICKFSNAPFDLAAKLFWVLPASSAFIWFVWPRMVNLESPDAGEGLLWGTLFAYLLQFIYTLIASIIIVVHNRKQRRLKLGVR